MNSSTTPKFLVPYRSYSGRQVMYLKKYVNALRFLLNRRKISKAANAVDEFVNWIRFANAGMLTEGNILAFDQAIKEMPDNTCVVEIGSFCGLSTNIINRLLTVHNKDVKIFTCDRWIFEGSSFANIADTAIKHSDYRQFVRDSFIGNTKFFSNGNLPYTIECYSDEFFELWNNNSHTRDVFGRDISLGGKIGFCYVDGNHTYNFAKRDFENTHQNLALGGFILFDDSSDWSGFELQVLIREILQRRDYRLVSNKPNYLFQKI